jgi:hypothetical protein
MLSIRGDDEDDDTDLVFGSEEVSSPKAKHG